MSNDRYERLRAALAMGPTPGPWEPVTDRPYSDLPYLVLGAGASDAKSAEWVPLYVHVGGRSGWMEQKANTLLIAACDPDTIRELLAERDQLAAALEAAREDAERWRHARRILTVEDIEKSQKIFDAFGLEGNEHENRKADAAIDRARGKGVKDEA